MIFPFFCGVISGLPFLERCGYQNNKKRFINRVALITGCGSESGIGFAVARLLVKSSARVFVTCTTDRIFKRKAELEVLGGTVAAHAADLTVFEQTQTLVGKAVDAFGGIDILVNNAGMTQVGDPEAIIHMADMIAFLASDEATYITGQVFVVDGGNTIQDYKGPRDGYY